MASRRLPRRWGGRLGKRAFDLVSALGALAVLSPILAIVAVLVLITDGRPVLFRQIRSGRDGRPFILQKFRTMTTEDDDPSTDAVRITRLGGALRATSLDELPTLWNVVRGDMSIVGPRPLLVRYLDRYSEEQRRRLEVRPGITGLAQVRGRNLLSWDERFALDVRYVDERTFIGDLRLIAETVRSVLRREGVAAEGGATMREFMGNGDGPPDDEGSAA